jgi:ribosomal protein L11 methyltransferase
VSRLELKLRAVSADVPRIEALLELAGAETISLRDAADDPVLEPEPDTAPLWPNVELRAQFAAGADLGPLCELLRGAGIATDAAVTALRDDDWQGGLRQAIAARPIGSRLWLAPADDGGVPQDRTVVRLNMGVAFGTGQHPTTALCLDWLEANTARGDVILDYGCGSGVLALAALALGASSAWAVDNDPQALLATRANAALNGVADRVHVAPPSALPALAVDVLAANILAGPLVALAPLLAGHVRPGGRVVLSGILEPQAAEVTAAYAPYLRDFERAALDGWVRLAAVRNLR